ncbi:unnamed protein product [Orchesella dallaii]|uniref:Uncharacterized protein n=1 Tax=Orchesella dallaii TaxID=48710 RepID=A0ABP1S2D4_9HEXA
MQLKVWLFPFGVLLMLMHLDGLMAEEPEPFGGREYPNIANCFKQFDQNQWLSKELKKKSFMHRLGCKSIDVKGEPVCYKLCMLERFEIIIKFEETGGRNVTMEFPQKAANAVGVLRSIDYDVALDEVSTEEERVAKLLTKCEELSVYIPKADVKPYCEELSPKYQEGIGKLIKCIEDALLHPAGLMASDPLAGIYPDVTNCFKGVIRQEESEALELNRKIKDDCKQDNPDETSVCFRDCMLQRYGIMDTFVGQDDHELFAKDYQLQSLTFGVQTVSSLLGIPWLIEVDISEEQKQQRRLFEKHYKDILTKCDRLSVRLSLVYDRKCKDFSPKYQESIGKLINCLEDGFLVRCFGEISQ